MLPQRAASPLSSLHPLHPLACPQHPRVALALQATHGPADVGCSGWSGHRRLEAVGAELLPLEMATDASWWRLRQLIQGFVV